MSNFDNKYLKKWLCVPGYDRRFKKIYQEMTLTGTYCILGFLIVQYCSTVYRRMDFGWLTGLKKKPLIPFYKINTFCSPTYFQITHSIGIANINTVHDHLFYLVLTVDHWHMSVSPTPRSQDPPSYSRSRAALFLQRSTTHLILLFIDHLTHLYGPALIIEETLEEAAYTNRSFNPEVLFTALNFQLFYLVMF